MAVDVGTAKGYLDLDISGFISSLTQANQAAQTQMGSIQQNFQSGLSNVGGVMTSAGKTLTAAVTAPIVGMGTAAVKTTADFDSAMSKVSAISGATGGDLDALREKAKEMGIKTKFSATESAEAFTYMAMAGWDTESMLQGIDGIMALSAADGLDLATTSDIVTDALTAFGLSASDSSHFADVLAKTSSSANTNVSMLGESFKYAAPVAGALGYSVEDTSIALGLMANAGIKGGQAGTTLRRALTNMISPSDKAAAAMEKYGIEITNADGTMKPLGEVMDLLRDKMGNLSEAEQAEAASTIFGTQAMSGMLAIINASDDDYKTLTDSIYDADGAAQQMADTMLDNLNGQLTLLKSALEGLAISFGEILMPYIQKAVEWIQQLVDKFNALSTEQKETIVKIALVAAAIGPLLLVGGKLLVGISNVMKAFQTLKTGMTALKAGFTGLKAAIGGISAPVVAIVAVIAVLVAAFKHLWDTNEEFRNKITEIWNGIKEKFDAFGQGIVERLNALGFDFENFTEVVGAIWDGFCNLLAPVFEAAFEIISSVLGTVLDVLTGLLDVFIGIFTGNWEQVWTGIKEIFSGIWDGIVGILEAALNMLKGIADVVLGWFGTSWDEVWGNIKSFFEGIWNGITSFFSNAVNTIKSVATTVFTAVSTFFSTIWNGIKTVFTTVVGAIGTFLSNAWNGIKTVVTTVFTAISTFFTTIWNNIKTTVTTVATSIWTGLTTIFNSVKDTITTIWSAAWNTIKTVVSTIINTIWTIIKTVFGNIALSITEIVMGIQNIISNIFNAIKSFLQGNTEEAKQFIVNAWTTAKNLVTALVNNIKNTISTVFNAIKTAITTIMTAISNFFTTTWNAIKTMITTVVNAIKTTISSVFTAIKTFLTTTLTAISNFFTTIWNTIKTTVTTVVNAIKTTISTVFNAIKTTVTTIMTAISTFMTNTWNAIKTAVTNTANNIKTAVSTAFTNLKSSVTSTVNSLKSSVETTFNNLKTAMSNAMDAAKTNVVNAMTNAKNGVVNVWNNIKSTFTDIGKNIIQGIIDGIGSMVSSLYDSIKNALSGLVDKAKSALGISSPSKVFRKQVGEWIPAGIAEGVEDAMPDAVKDIQDSIDDGLSKVDGDIDVGFGARNNVQTAFSAFKNVYGDLVLWFEDIEKRIDNSINNMRDSLVSLIDQGRVFVNSDGTLGYVGYDGFTPMANRNATDRTMNDNQGRTQGNTYVFYSNKEIDEIEAARRMRQTERDIAEGFL